MSPNGSIVMGTNDDIASTDIKAFVLACKSIY